MKNYSRKQFKKIANQGGFTLLEAIFVLLIALGAYFLATTNFNDGTTSQSLTDEGVQIAASIGRTKSNFATKPAYTGSTIPVLIGLGVFPDSMVNGTTARSVFGGNITAAVSTTTSTDDTQTWTIPGYKKKECAGLAQRIESHVITISVNGTPVKTAGNTNDNAALSAACTTGLNTISFTFGKT
jgi:type II secretory pathway pseudopilin PulG